MQWFDVLGLGLDAVNFVQIQKTRQQIRELEAGQISEILRQQLIGMAKNIIFASNQSAQALAERAEAEPQPVYVAAQLLDLRLNSIGVTAEAFPEFSDKEYVSQALNRINRLLKSSKAKLSETQIADADHCVKLILEMPELNQAIESEKENEKFRGVHAKIKSLNEQLHATDDAWAPLDAEKRRRGLIGFGLAFAGPAVVCFGSTCVSSGLSNVLVSLAGNDTFSGIANSLDAFYGTMIPLMGCGLTIGSFVWGLIYALKSPSKEYAELAKQRSEIQRQIPAAPKELPLPAAFVGKSLANLEELKAERQRFIYGLMGQTDDDYGMVFLTE